MKNTHTTFLTIPLIFIALLSTTVSAAQYKITALGGTFAAGINNAGNTVTSTGDRHDDSSHGDYNLAGGPATQVPFLPGNFNNWASGINNNNQVAIENRVTVDTGVSVSIYDIDSGISTKLGSGQAFAINDNGNVLGKNFGKVSLFSTSGITEVSGFEQYKSVTLNSLNNNNVMIGSVQGRPNGFGSRGFINDGSGVTELGVLDGDLSVGLDINDLNQAVGTVFDLIVNDTFSKAFYWEDGVMSELGLLEGFQNSTASGINNNGQVVGSANNGNGIFKAVIYDNGSALALEDMTINSDGWQLLNAYDINDNGQILGNGYFNGQEQAFLLTEVPLPASFWLMSSGLLALVSVRGQKRKN